MGGLLFSIQGTLLITFLQVADMAKEKQDVVKYLDKRCDKTGEKSLEHCNMVIVDAGYGVYVPYGLVALVSTLDSKRATLHTAESIEALANGRAPKRAQKKKVTSETVYGASVFVPCMSSADAKRLDLASTCWAYSTLCRCRQMIPKKWQTSSGFEGWMQSLQAEADKAGIVGKKDNEEPAEEEKEPEAAEEEKDKKSE